MSKGTSSNSKGVRKSMPDLQFSAQAGIVKRRNTVTSKLTPSSKNQKARKSITWSDSVRIEIPEQWNGIYGDIS